MNIVKNLERVRYFTGQLLSSEDFQEEQSYLLDRLRRHNRYLHGWGVVFGLEVSISNTNVVVVTPGLAIDCAGNEITVEDCLRIAISPSEVTIHVAIRYREIPVRPVPTFHGTEFSRIREGAEVVLLENNPSANHQGFGPGTPGCGQAHPLCLARLKWHQSKWQLRQAPVD